MHWRSVVPAAVLSVLLPLSARAATDGDGGADEETEESAGQPALPSNLDDLSLEELLAIPISVATRTAKPIRESPAVLTLVTRDQIIASGARDLTDVLQLVPGFSFGVDLKGVVGLGFRGNWAHEGKVLMLVDGQELNELLYYNVVVGNHLPVEQIEKVEIIRGPGSVIYGGSAELAVVNVITRGAKEIDGVHTSISYGQTEEGLARRNLGLSWGGTLAKDLTVSISGFGSQGNRSSEIYTDFNGDTVDLSNGNSALNNLYLNGAATWKKLELRAITDQYSIVTRDGYGEIFPDKVRVDFNSTFFEAKYRAKAEGFDITPRFSYKRQNSWATRTNYDYAPYYDQWCVRYVGEVTASKDVVEGTNVLLGSAATLDDTFQRRAAGTSEFTQRGRVQQFFGGRKKKTYLNGAAWLQVLQDLRIANLSAGVRVEQHSLFGASAVPRVALTRAWDRLHVKALASAAFRTPSMDNLDYNPEIRPERTEVFEGEAGYRIGQRMFVSANVYDITIRDTIVYSVNDAGEDNYFNLGRSGTRGVELSWQAALGRHEARVTGSYYSAAGKNQVAPYAVPGDDSVLLGAPSLKVTAAGTISFGRGITLAPSVVYLGERHGYLTGDSGGTGVLGKEQPTLLANAFVQWRATERLDVGLGIYNALAADYSYLQPYDGAHPPLPAESREIAGRVSWSF